MKTSLLTIALLAVCMSSVAHAESFSTPNEAAIAAFKRSPVIQAAIVDSCVGKPHEHQTVASVLSRSDAMGFPFPVLVIQEYDCMVTNSLGAIVFIKSGVDGSGNLAFVASEPKVADLTPLWKNRNK
jgi:hypothetical protein